MIHVNVPYELLATVAALARMKQIPDSVPLELQELMASLTEQKADVWKAYCQLHRLSCGIWGNLHAFRVEAERPMWPNRTDPYGILTLCGAHAETWPADHPSITRVDDTNTASECAICKQTGEQLARETAELVENARKHEQALLVWLGIWGSRLHHLRSLDTDDLPAAIERMHSELCCTDTTEAATEALETLVRDIGRHERMRVEADVAAITGVLPELLAVLERMGGNTDLADRVRALAHRLRDHYEGKPYGHKLIQALEFYANPAIYSLNPKTAVAYGFAADLPPAEQDRGRMARLAMGTNLPREEDT